MKITNLIKLIFLVLASSSTTSYANSARGEMSCTVTGSVVVASEEGKFKQYAGIDGGANKGDKLSMTYVVTNGGIYVTLQRPGAKKPILTSSFLDFGSPTVAVDRGQKDGYVVVNRDYNHSISLTSEYIRSEEFRTLVLHRYYKSDWHGFFSNVDPLGVFTQTLTLNCRHDVDQMDAAFQMLNKAMRKK